MDDMTAWILYLLYVLLIFYIFTLWYDNLPGQQKNLNYHYSELNKGVSCTETYCCNI